MTYKLSSRLITDRVQQDFSSDGESSFSWQGSFQTNQWEGRSNPVTGKFPGFPPPTNTTLPIMCWWDVKPYSIINAMINSNMTVTAVHVRKLVEVVVDVLDRLGVDGAVDLCEVLVDFIEQFQRDGAVAFS